MDKTKVKIFSQLAGQEVPESFDQRSPELRELGAQLLLSEVLEYIIHGLGVQPQVDGTPITEPDNLKYKSIETVDELESVDGLADVAYTMYWNACCFGIPLEEAFEKVCDNNLSKFVHLQAYQGQVGSLDQGDWDLGLGVSWPEEVRSVEIIEVEKELYAVGKDGSGKVRKPSTYRPVDLKSLLSSSS